MKIEYKKTLCVSLLEKLNRLGELNFEVLLTDGDGTTLTAQYPWDRKEAEDVYRASVLSIPYNWVPVEGSLSDLSRTRTAPSPLSPCVGVCSYTVEAAG